jgi:hypothetical protein
MALENALWLDVRVVVVMTTAGKGGGGVEKRVLRRLTICFDYLLAWGWGRQ